MRYLSFVCLAFLLAPCMSCSNVSEPSGSDTLMPAAEADESMPLDEPAAPQLQAQSLGSIRNLHTFGDIYFAGALTADDLKLLRDRGVKTIVNLRTAPEFDWDEAGEIERLGMRYVYTPFRSAEELTPAMFDRWMTVLREPTERPIMIHCASANRVGPVWYAYRVLEGGLSPEAALAEAKTIGLRNLEYIDAAKAYVEGQQP